MLTSASAALYSASRQRSYINAVRILIPDTWRNIPANVTTWEIFSVIFFKPFSKVKLNEINLLRMRKFKSIGPTRNMETNRTLFNWADVAILDIIFI